MDDDSIGDSPEFDSRPAGQQPVRRLEKASATTAIALPVSTPSGFHTITIKADQPTSTMAPGSTPSGFFVLHRAAATETPKPHRQTSGPTDEVSSSTKVTIGVSVMVGIFVVTALVVFHLKMKMRARSRRRISRPIKPSSLPPTPLISPSSSYAGPPTGPLTPPPRLQERCFLLPRALSLRRSNPHRRYNDEHSQEWAGLPLAPLSPLSPLSISRARRGPEEGERGRITATTTISQTTSPTRPLRDDALPPGTSVSSVFSSASTVRATSNASNDSTQQRFSGVTATDLPRPPPRVYEAPPMVGGLASPGPPPTRALPSLPSDGCTSPLRPPASPVRRGSPRAASGSGSSVAVNGINGDFQRPREENNRGTRSSVDTALQSPRRVRHVRSPLLNEVSLDTVMKK